MPWRRDCTHSAAALSPGEAEVRSNWQRASMSEAICCWRAVWRVRRGIAVTTNRICPQAGCSGQRVVLFAGWARATHEPPLEAVGKGQPRGFDDVGGAADGA